MSADKRIIHKTLANSDSLIYLENVRYSYDNRNDVIHDINLKISAGEKLALVGPSGSGKTTLGLLMAGLLDSNKGILKIKSRSLADYTMKDLRSLITMAMQLPERALFEETVADDIRYGPVNIGKADVETIVNSYLDKFRIARLRNRHPFSLSGGEKRKAALAGILAMESEIIILDEPSAALDTDATDQLINLINSLIDKTIIIISHDIEFAGSIVDRFVGINEGKITFDLPTAKFLSYMK